MKIAFFCKRKLITLLKLFEQPEPLAQHNKISQDSFLLQDRIHLGGGEFEKVLPLFPGVQ
jgi:hypothetical protein